MKKNLHNWYRKRSIIRVSYLWFCETQQMGPKLKYPWYHNVIIAQHLVNICLPLNAHIDDHVSPGSLYWGQRRPGFTGAFQFSALCPRMFPGTPKCPGYLLVMTTCPDFALAAIKWEFKTPHRPKIQVNAFKELKNLLTKEYSYQKSVWKTERRHNHNGQRSSFRYTVIICGALHWCRWRTVWC